MKEKTRKIRGGGMEIAIPLLATVLFAGPTWGQEQDNPYRKCGKYGWNDANSGEKVAFVFGWVMGVENSVLLTKKNIMPQLWPTGRTVGGLVNEIDVLCQRAENKNADLGEIIRQVAREKSR